MKFYIQLLFFFNFALSCLYLWPQETYAQSNKPPKSLIQFVKPIYFALPIDCRINEDCWVMNYVDMEPEDGKSTDIACLNRTYDTHKGTDIAIADEATMLRGVNVLAPADGTVKRTRDGEADKWLTQAQLEEIKQTRKECGNAILVDHGSGYQTIYCHLKQNSIRVKADQKVKKGDVIAQVGLSGLTEFPHLHFGILKDNKVVDPFTGQPNDGKCGIQKNRLWDKELVFNYQPLSIYGAGFSDQIPTLEALDKKTLNPKSLKQNPDVLTFWVNIFGVRSGDIITMEIKDPNGKVFVTRNIEQPKIRARQFYFTGKKLYGSPLMAGAYTGHVKIIRSAKDKEPLKWKKTVAVLVTP